jgi:hypothetical protein
VLASVAAAAGDSGRLPNLSKPTTPMPCDTTSATASPPPSCWRSRRR